jgi:hypothetical protein
MKCVNRLSSHHRHDQRAQAVLSRIKCVSNVSRHDGPSTRARTASDDHAGKRVLARELLETEEALSTRDSRLVFCCSEGGPR